VTVLPVIAIASMPATLEPFEHVLKKAHDSLDRKRVKPCLAPSFDAWQLRHWELAEGEGRTIQDGAHARANLAGGCRKAAGLRARQRKVWVFRCYFREDTTGAIRRRTGAPE
jgi:hypothetical protein